jgi:hypothetical protein
MRSDIVVVYPPVLNYFTGIFQADEPIRIQALVTHPSDEALCKSILDRFPWPDEIELNTFTISPFILGTEPNLVSPKGRYFMVVSIWLPLASVIREVLVRLSWWI